MTIPFLIIAILTVGGTAAAMGLRNPIHCVLALTLSFAGIAALYLSDHVSTPAATSTWIIDQATTGVIAPNAVDTVNRLVYKSDL